MRNPVLISYAYFRDWPEDRLRKLLGNKLVEWLVDSGGFTALNAGWEVKLQDYCDWLLKWKRYLHGYIALDVVGDPGATDRNLRLMQKAGLQPIPVHVWGDGQKRMDELFELSPWVALGGLRRPHRLHAPKSYVVQKHKWARGRRVHWLGYTRNDMLTTFRPYSCDSSNCTAGYRYGRLSIYHGDCRTWTVHAMLGERSTEVPFSMAELRWVERCGFHRLDLSSPRARRKGSSNSGVEENRLGTITMNSCIRYSRDMLQHYGVRVYNAVTNVDVDAIVREIEKEEARCR